MDKVSFVSLNTRGLADPSKRRDVFSHLRQKKYSIICLQDTHFTKSLERVITSEWGYKVWFSSFRSNSRGVAILFKNDIEFKVHHSYSDNFGNVLLLDIELFQKRITLVNIYGPNEDNPAFYERLKDIIIKQGNANIVITGDWNLLLDPT